MNKFKLMRVIYSASQEKGTERKRYMIAEQYM